MKNLFSKLYRLHKIPVHLSDEEHEKFIGCPVDFRHSQKNSADLLKTALFFFSLFSVSTLVSNGQEPIKKWEIKQFLTMEEDSVLKKLPNKPNRVGITVKPVFNSPVDKEVKYVSFEYGADTEFSGNAKLSAATFIAGSCKDKETAISRPATRVIHRKILFELPCPFNLEFSEETPSFTLEFEGEVPEISYTMTDSEENEIFTGKIDQKSQEPNSLRPVNPLSGENHTSELLNVYPNPASGMFWVDYTSDKRSAVRIRIINQLGQTVRSVNQGSSFQERRSVEIDAEGLSPGVYHVFVEFADKVRNRPIIIKK